MAVLEKIRVKLGILITVLIAVALLSFIIDPTTLDTTLRSFSSKYDVGNIDGNKISYTEFQKELDYYNNIYKLSTGSQSVSEQAMDQINEMAWQNLIQKYYMIPQIKKAGINVGDDELVEMSQGKEISPVLLQDPAFRDASGNFSREMFLDFIQAISSDPSGNLAQYWEYIQNMMTNQQYFAKYSSLLTQSNIITPVELRRQIEENNTTANVDFVLVPYGFEPDSTITVSDDEIRNYYENHKENYKQRASRDIEFVAYEVIPSEEDILQTEKEVNDLFEEFSKTDNLKVFLARNSDSQFSNYFYKKGELEYSMPEIDEFAFGKNPTVMPVFRKGNTFYSARVTEFRTMPDSVFVQHILLPADAQKQADSLLALVNKGTDFSTLASANSLDTNPNVAKPGDIGWLTQSMMIPGMESVLMMEPGKARIITTNYGIHIVRITERTKPLKKAQIAIFSREAVASKDTYQDYYAKANDLASRSEGKIANFQKITMDEKLDVVPADGVLQGARQLSRYDDVKEVVRWVYEAKEGDVSPIITVNNNIFFVVALKNVREDGYASVNDVASSIKYHLESEKRMDKVKSEVEEKIKGLSDLKSVAEKLGQSISNKEQMSFGSITDGSTEPALLGAVSSAELNKVTGPVKGMMGVYVFQVNGRETASFYTEQDAKTRAMQIQGFQINTLPVEMMNSVEIVDSRVKFF